MFDYFRLLASTCPKTGTADAETGRLQTRYQQSIAPVSAGKLSIKNHHRAA